MLGWESGLTRIAFLSGTLALGLYPSVDAVVGGEGKSGVGVGVGVGVSLDPGCGSRDVSGGGGGAQVAVSLSGFAPLSLGLTVH